MADPLKPRKISRVTSSENGDRLSNLPEPVLHHIFSFLETVDIVRASAVSRKWRYLWVSVPFLNFNVERISSRWSNSSELKNFVNWVLMYRDGSIDIQRFCLMGYPDIHYGTLYRWISVLVRRNLQELDLEINPSFGPIKLPHCLVTCESLRALKLHSSRNRSLWLPTTGFRQLKSLDLEFVQLSDGNVFGNFVSSCPLLEDLKLKECEYRGFEILDISATRLKNLTIHSYDSDGLVNSEIKVDCPSLESLVFNCDFIRDLSLHNLNSIQDVFIRLDGIYKDKERREDIMRYDDVMYKIINGLSCTRVLHLLIARSKLFRQALAKPECFSPAFYNVKSMILHVDMDDCNVLPILSLLNCCPNLGDLMMKFVSAYQKHRPCKIPDFCRIQDKELSCWSNHLKRVELHEFFGSRNELQLVRFLLSNGHVLQRMSISWLYHAKNHNKIISKVKEFRRSSPNVALKFHKHKRVNYFEFPDF